MADENWKNLETNPEGKPNHLDHLEKIKWATDLAANYTSIYKAFLKKIRVGSWLK